jgi:hypothetical protein
VSIDGHVVDNIDALTLPDRPDAPKLGGVIGVDAMKGQLAVMDFGCHTAALLPLQSMSRAVGTAATKVKAGSVTNGQQLTFPVTVHGATGVGILDTGARSSLINTAFARAAALDLQSSMFHHGEPARGATRTAVGTLAGPIGTVRFAGLTRKDVTARIVDLPSFQGTELATKPAMIVGLDLLDGVRLSVDFSGRQFWVAPSRCANSK